MLHKGIGWEHQIRESITLKTNDERIQMSFIMIVASVCFEELLCSNTFEWQVAFTKRNWTTRSRLKMISISKDKKPKRWMELMGVAVDSLAPEVKRDWEREVKLSYTEILCKLEKVSSLRCRVGWGVVGR